MADANAADNVRRAKPLIMAYLRPYRTQPLTINAIWHGLSGEELSHASVTGAVIELFRDGQLEYSEAGYRLADDV